MNEHEKKRILWLLSESERVEGVVCVGGDWPSDLFTEEEIAWLEDEIESIMEMGWRQYRVSRSLTPPQPSTTTSQ